MTHMTVPVCHIAIVCAAVSCSCVEIGSADVVENGRYFFPFSTVQRNGIGGLFLLSNLQIRQICFCS